MKSFLFLLGLVSHIYAFYPSTSDVIELNPANFDRLVLQSEAVWIVEFYAPWCGHCQQLVPEYEKTAKALKEIIKVGAVNADEHKSLASQYGVRGFPTIKIFGGNKKTPTDYAGERTAKALSEAGLAEANKQVKQRLGGRDKSGSSSSLTEVIELTDSNFDKLVLNSDDIWLVEFFAPWCGHCKNLAPHWEKAAAELKGKVKLGALDATSNTLKAQQYKIQGYPTIKYFPKGSNSPSDALEYDGGRTAESVISWALAKHAENVPAPEIVQIVNEKSFHSNCEGKPLCVVSVLPHILDCNAECRNTYLDILQELGDKYKSKMWGWVWAEGGTQHDLENSLEIGGFGYPAMAVVNFKKMKYSTLKGAFSRDGISDFLRDISFGRGQTAPVKGATIPKIYSIDPWDGKDGELPAEEEVDLSDIDLNDKDEL